MGSSRFSARQRLSKLLRLSAPEFLFLAGAMLCVGTARLALWLLPFRMVSRLGQRRVSTGPKVRSPETPEAARTVAASQAQRRLIQRVAWAATVAGGVLGGQRVCLARALAARWMLAALGCPSQLRIGVAKGADGKFMAHAWLESYGEMVVGGDEAQDYAALPPLDPSRSQTTVES